MKKIYCVILLLICLFIMPSTLPAAILGSGMTTFNGTLKKITETATLYKIKIGDKDFQIPKNNRNLMKNAKMMVGKTVTITYQTKDHKIRSLRHFKAATSK